MTGNKTAMITGASAGIGEATARLLAEKKYSLLLVARREDRLKALAEECRRAGAPKVAIAALDVSDRKAVEGFFAVEGLLRDLTVLVNAAGLAAGVDPVDTAKLEDWETMVDTNVMGLLYVTRLALPALKKNRGHIVNLGSVAGRWTYKGGAVYCATKAAVISISEGLRHDLLGSGVRVSNIEPGMVETEFSVVRLKDESAAKKVYDGMTPLTAKDVAETIEWCLSRPAHVNIQEMMIFPTDQAAIGVVHRKS